MHAAVQNAGVATRNASLTGVYLTAVADGRPNCTAAGRLFFDYMTGYGVDVAPLPPATRMTVMAAALLSAAGLSSDSRANYLAERARTHVSKFWGVAAATASLGVGSAGVCYGDGLAPAPDSAACAQLCVPLVYAAARRGLVTTPDIGEAACVALAFSEPMEMRQTPPNAPLGKDISWVVCRDTSPSLAPYLVRTLDIDYAVNTTAETVCRALGNYTSAMADLGECFFAGAFGACREPYVDDPRGQLPACSVNAVDTSGAGTFAFNSVAWRPNNPPPNSTWNKESGAVPVLGMCLNSTEATNAELIAQAEAVRKASDGLR